MALKSGTIALVGRPNAGKSTLMNRLLTEKLAIVSDKPQTTRQVLIGILSGDRGQIVFYDTPGMHKPLHRLNRQMVRAAREALTEADAVCLVVDASISHGAGEAFMLDLVTHAESPRILVLNKIDRLDKTRLLPIIEHYSRATDFAEIIPASALTGDGCDLVLEALWSQLPEGEPVYHPDLLTVHPERFLAAERIREKVLNETMQELPFTSAVLIDQWEEVENTDLTRIYARILVETRGQKKIIVGKGGQRIRSIGTAARHDLEEFLGRRVYLDLHVAVEEGWREKSRILASLEHDLLEIPRSETIPD
jgi:GTP-binding protein Era